MMRKIILITLLVATCFLFSSCSAIFSINSAAKIKAVEDDEKIEVYNEGTEKYEDLGTGEVDYKLNNYKDYYLVRSSKEGRRSRSTPLTRSKFNAVKLIDLFIPLIADGLLVYSFSSTNGNGNNLTGPAWIIGTVGWLGMGLSPWRKFENQYELPKLEPLPIKNEDMGFVSIKKVGMNITGFNEKYYDNLPDFNNGKTNYERIYSDPVHENDLDFSMGMNRLLDKWKFRDSTKVLLSPFYASYKLSCDITGITEHRIGQLISAEIESTWKVYQPYQTDPVFERKFNTFSNWTPYSSENRYLNAHVNALENNLLDVLSDKEVQEHIKKQDMVASPVNESYEMMSISVEESYVANIEDAVKAVVTIKSKSGHGSGCLISKDGLIVTNYHVINSIDSTEKLTVVTNDGKEYPCEVVRFNQAYDLAIVKVDKMDIKPFLIKEELDATLGKEVYAIGTPSDIELGQTLSKGIISGKRKFDDRVYIQTDVSINGGNSGGALIDKEGNLLGIVNAKIVGVGVEGIGFAIPGNYILVALKIGYEK